MSARRLLKIGALLAVLIIPKLVRPQAGQTGLLPLGSHGVGVEARGEGGEDLAASARVAEPVLGYVLDPAVQALRPIVGIPGAATLGPALGLGFPVSWGAFSPEQDYFLGVASDERRLVLIRLAGDTISPVFLPGVGSVGGPVVVSPTGRWAAVRSSLGEMLYVIDGLAGGPFVARQADLSDLPGSVTCFAVSDNGTVLTGVSLGGAAMLVVFEAHGGARRWLDVPLGAVNSLAFLKNRADALVVDQSANTVSLIRDVDGVSEWILLATERDGISSPVDVAVAGDSEKFFVANGGTSSIAMFDFVGRRLGVFPSPRPISGFQRLKGNSTFRITDLSEEPIWLLDGDSDAPRVVFVPRLVEEKPAGTPMPGRED